MHRDSAILTWIVGNLALAEDHGRVSSNHHMRPVSGSIALFAGLIALNFTACRHRTKRAPTARSAPSASAVVSNGPKLSSSMRSFDAKPLKIGELSALRFKAIEAVQVSFDKHASANDAMIALAHALADAPGSTVLAIELTKAAHRAKDENRFRNYQQIAQRSLVAFPKLSSALDRGVSGNGPKAADARPQEKKPANARPATELEGVTELKGVCSWLVRSFQLGRPPVEYVGDQGTESIECETQTTYLLTPELPTATVLVSVKGNGERVFAWVAAQHEGHLWLSPVVAESFAPSYHPQGNGFKVELQRNEAFRAGLPELVADVSERSTVIDVALNEMVVTERHRSVVMTFDVQPPQVSVSIELQSRIERSIVDPSDVQLPKGYVHSPDLGRVTEESYRTEWGNNQVRLTRTAPLATKPRVQMLFNATNPVP